MAGEALAEQELAEQDLAEQELAEQDLAAQEETCQCKYKATPRSDELQRDIQQRLNRAIGQLGGIKNMIDDNRYCGDVLIQLAAVQSAIKRVSEIILKEHLQTCVVEGIRAGDDDVIPEVIDLMRKFS